MLVGLLAALLFAPLYWLAVPRDWRRGTLMVASLAALGAYDPRLLVLLGAVCVGLTILLRLQIGAPPPRRTAIAAAGLAGLGALFLWNKLAGGGTSALSSQGGLVFLGVSYLVLKAAGALIDASRGTLRDAPLDAITSWIVFLPTYPSGPMETFDHFRRQTPEFDRVRVFGGLERILLGLVKALVAAHYLGVFASPIVAAPERRSVLELAAALYASSLRFYLDFSGYSDIAIGLAAVFGYDIDENFDRPLFRRNLAQLWQHWHMTLTRWLRAYLFVPVSRRVMRLGGARFDSLAIALGQIVAMTFCGLWHGVAWNFALWGFSQALGLIWVGSVARRLGAVLPPGLVEWWRTSRVAFALSAFLTFNFFSLTVVLAVTDAGGAFRYLRALAGWRG